MYSMLNLRKVLSQDETFLYEVYAGTRRDELQATGWSGETLDAFLRMQFDVQKRSFALQHPDADHQLVLLDDVPAGRIMTAVAEDSLLLVDVSLLPAYRQNGIGTRLIQDLQQKAKQSAKSVRLHVVQDNPARNLYARLGFVVTGERFPYFAMEWQA
jgi:ribosomal protein S18 acetylase RimI-like enzyme